MSVLLNQTHDPSRRSWVPSANFDGTEFPIQNLPFGVVRQADRIFCGVAIGESILDVSKCISAFDGIARDAAYACDNSSLNKLMALGNASVSALRARLVELLTEGNATGQNTLQSALSAAADCCILSPVRIAGYTDFFASIHHATNAGSLFRPDAPLLPNYKHVPIGYNGRANSVRVSGVPVTRPHGQTKAAQEPLPSFGPAMRLDYEVELGAYIGSPSVAGDPVQLRHAWDHIFGFSLLNDWSARDIQAWEYQPLGPFLAKTFATSVSPWIVTAEALAPFRTPAFARPTDDPSPLEYLSDDADRLEGGLKVTLEAFVRTRAMRETGAAPFHLSSSDASDLYWTFGQMVTHHTSNGSSLDTGDLIGSGTVSGAGDNALGSLLEITKGGSRPLHLPTGEIRTWLEDGDEITLRGHCARPGFRSIGFGSCTATIAPANRT
ncbi:fumarylacetoacetase [Caballeronia sp. J97]|uniref:fumarylacetoacetase n=1 Tax=Caballeronia sp. J97 TaxID=2805429 RepID=UPI002AB0E493|nr:fumarylacetoacetase [Caballeronia sp. J97]